MIEHVFLLMLENRSFDHMLGYSGITGNAVGGGLATLEGMSAGGFANVYNSQSYPTTPDADDIMPFDPGHEFPDVLEQLAGTGASYSPNRYPLINNSGFVANYATTKSPQEGGATTNFGEIMKCYPADGLPALKALARQFAVCDHWYSSLPGPTWPNRFFAMAASSGGLDCSPSDLEMGEWMVDGFEFQNGDIFQAIANQPGLGGWKLYAGSHPPIACALRGVSLLDAAPLDQLASDLAAGSYAPSFTLIEPNYGDSAAGTYKGGNSQHPMDSALAGDALIQRVYESIRSSSIWNQSLLIITYDEHGGFYDHCVPPPAIPPGDLPMHSNVNRNGFTFDQLGVRVPAVVVSPLIPANTIDHTVYDHSSISATLHYVFGTKFLTNRDEQANNPAQVLATLPNPRPDCPPTIGPPPPPLPAAPNGTNLATAANDPIPATGNSRGFLGILLKTDVELSPPEQRQSIISEFNLLRTKGDFAQYRQKVMAKVAAAQAAESGAGP